MNPSLESLTAEGQGRTLAAAQQERIHAISSPMKLKVMLDEARYVHVGRGSLRALGRLRVYRTSPDAPLMAEIGHYSDFARCNILIGGEHTNKEVINYTFPDLHILADKLYDGSEWKVSSHAKGVTRIGSNVVVGLDALILSGVTIGDGAVIGAGAVVTRDVPPYAIVAGNPAKVVGMRFSDAEIKTLLELRWWDIDPVFLWQQEAAFNEKSPTAYAEALRKAAKGKIPYDTSDSRLVLNVLAYEANLPVKYGLGGFEHAGAVLKPQQLPPLARAYLTQLNQPDGQPVHALWHPQRLFEATA